MLQRGVAVMLVWAFILFQEITELCGDKRCTRNHSAAVKMMRRSGLSEKSRRNNKLFVSFVECRVFVFHRLLLCRRCYSNSPSMPIFPSQSLSPAVIRAFVSGPVSSRAPGKKFWRNSLRGGEKLTLNHIRFIVFMEEPGRLKKMTEL